MIFVTVGTHEQPFDRLLKCIDKMVEDGDIKEEVVVQKGYTDFEPRHCKSKKLIGYEEMQEYIRNARIVLTHGGPASFIAPLSIGKIPIVVPRKKIYNEHVNDHQLVFSKEVAKRLGTIIVAETDEEIRNSIINYCEICKNMSKDMQSNNKYFNERLSELVDEIYGN